MHNYLCIGSSAAGLAAARAIRQTDKAAHITVLTAEHEMPYNRCSLVDYLAGERTEQQIRTRQKAFFIDNNITLRLSTPIVAIEPDQQRVLTAHGEYIGYDKLFLGMGRSSSKLQIPGAAGSGVFSFYDLDDTNAVARYITQESVKHATIIGAGVTGLECADALRKLGLSVAVTQRSTALLSRYVNAAGSLFLEEQALQHGLQVYKETAVQEVQRVNGKVTGVLLHDGSVLATQMVIFAVGGRSNAWLADEAGIEVTGGAITTNRFLQTSIENIYAGGDVAQVTNVLTGQPEQATLWADAGMQGRIAGSNMAGDTSEYAGMVPITVTEIFGVRMAFAGSLSTQHQLHVKKHQDFYHCFATKQGALQGFVMIGNMMPLGSLRQAMVSQQVIPELL